MLKLMLALHGEALAAVVGSPGLRAELAGSGVTTLQANLDDEAVAAAMRFGPGQRITGIVSVWTEADPYEAVRVVAETADEPGLHAYRVSERVRLDPAPMPDGVRSDVLAQVALLRKPASMSHEDYLSYWMLRHTPIAIRTQATSAYVQNIVEEALTPTSPAIAAIVEEHFPMAAMGDPHAFYGSGGDDAELQRRFSTLMDSVARFGADKDLDLVPTSRYFWTLQSSA